jgi:hypothetical protein
VRRKTPAGWCLPAEGDSVRIIDTLGRRVRVEWDSAAAVTPLGQLVYFAQFLAVGGLFADWVRNCPLAYTSPNAPAQQDVLGTILLSALAGHSRYAHIAALRCDKVNPVGLGMTEVQKGSNYSLNRQRRLVPGAGGIQSQLFRTDGRQVRRT